MKSVSIGRKTDIFVEGFYLLKCKVCGAANSPDSSVCAECGAKLRPRRKYSADSNKEIFSDTKSEELVKSGEQRDLFSSGEKYEK